MSATEFTADLRDIRFVLHEQLSVADLPTTDHHSEADVETVDALLEETYRIATEVLNPMNAPGDAKGCTFDGEGNVTTPPGYRAAWQVLAEGGWLGLSADPAYGGLGMPHTIAAAVGELHIGACMAFAIYAGLTRSAANLLAHFAADDVRELVCSKMYAGEWAGTMCLTESHAGSSVGDNRAKAQPIGDGTYHLVGEKVFISGGDHDLTDNIIHLVLARLPDAPGGTKGLSLFLVPKYAFDAEGNLGDRNGAVVGGIEEKMGIHGSATCTLILGADKPCVGYLLGNANEGMRIMFTMMNEARIEVGVQGLAGASAGYQLSVAYAKERVQGTSIKQFGDPNAARVPIIAHPDVRRMLMWQKVHAETMRSLVYSTAHRMDTCERTADPQQRKAQLAIVELLTPIVKSYCSDRGFDSTVLGLQVYGGSGYISEYPIEQLVRDTKISSIYEGTNGIQAMDLLGRKMRQGSGAVFMAWLNEVNAELDACKGIEDLAAEVTAVAKARDALGASAMHLGGLGASGQIATAMLHACHFLDQFGNVALAHQALIQARLALAALANGAEGDEAKFYRSKVLNARFYCANVLPHSIALGRIIRTANDSCLDESLFD